MTPDSFSEGGIYFQRDKAIGHGLSMAGDGADIIDVGGSPHDLIQRKFQMKKSWIVSFP